MNPEPVTLSTSAANAIEQIKIAKEIPTDFALRIDVKGNASGCGGFGYKLGFDSKKDTDIEYIHQGVKILIEKKKVMFLMSLEVDYVNNDEETGFFFDKKIKV
jgi:iron-sulfur cluster assembly protein